MVEFKVGDRVVFEDKTYTVMTAGLKDKLMPRYGVFLEGYPLNGRSGFDDTKNWYIPESQLTRVDTTPPTTITHEGYTYTRGERVLPDWVKDGAWVVGLEDGEIAEIVSVNDNFVRVKSPSASMQMRHEAAEFAGYFRPFTAKDWKWGMWADYCEKRVFVMGGVNVVGSVRCSHESFFEGYCNVPSDLLTPAK